MNEAYVTLQGWVGSDVTIRETRGGEVATFRVGSTPRFFKAGGWQDGQTSWYTVNAWRSLGHHVEESLHRGDAVVVHGRLRVDVWERADHGTSVTYLVDATFVGHDLNKGSSTFTKAPRVERTDPAEDPVVKEAVHSFEVEGPQLDSDGEPVEPAA